MSQVDVEDELPGWVLWLVAGMRPFIWLHVALFDGQIWRLRAELWEMRLYNAWLRGHTRYLRVKLWWLK